MLVKIYIGSTQVELHEEESISLTSSVTDIADITKNTTDYTKQFTVPASAENNKLFKHYYNANIDNTYDARVKVDGFITLGGLFFKKGKFLLHKVQVKSNKPISYTLNFFGNLVSLKDLFGKEEISDLDLSAYDHPYSSSQVKTGLTSSLFSGDVVYSPFTKKQLFYSSDSSDNTQLETLSNIAYGGGADTGIIWNDLRPSLKLIRIIEAIEVKYDITFSRHFFGRSEFAELFLWMNADSEETIGGEELQIDWDSGSTTYVNQTTDIAEFDTENRPRRWWQLYPKITPSAGYENVPYKIHYYRNRDDEGSEFTEAGVLNCVGTKEWKNSLHASGASSDYRVYYTISADQEFKFTSKLFQQRRDYWGKDGDWSTWGSEQTIDSGFIMSDNTPKLKVIDFLKGLFKKYKLVVIPQVDGTFYVNTLAEYYAEGELLDVTEHIDYEEYDVERGNILNTISYKFSEPTTILNMQFEENTGTAYGDEEAYIRDENGELLDGEALEFELPFEQIVYERLTDINDNVQTNIQYGAIINEELKPVNPKAHIHYNINQAVETKTVGFIDGTGAKSDLGSNINIPHYQETLEDASYSTLFSQEFSTWDGNMMEDTLYSNYHQSFINALFNIKRRNYTFTIKRIPLPILLALSLNDVIKIKNNYYRFDKFTVDLVNLKCEFNLVNTFNFLLSAISASDLNITLTKEAQSYNSFVTNLNNYSVTKIDNGSGTDWITVTDNGAGILTFTLTENSGVVRDMLITITDTDTNIEIQYYISQEDGTL